MKHLRFTAVLMILWLAGCSLPPKIYTSRPAAADHRARQVHIRFAPEKIGAGYFSAFHLSIDNRSDATLTVDWNRTRYLFNGKDQGVFVFAGIDPQQIKAGTVPPEVIRSGEALSKRIGPLRLVSWAPVRDVNQPAHRPGIHFGPLPAGGHGIDLVTVRNGKIQHQRLQLRILARQAP